MRIHHLDCGSHCPLGGAAFDGLSHGPLARIPTRCLLVEGADGLILVDSGYGLQDVAHPHPRLPHLWRAVLNVRLRAEDTAIRQIERLGHSPREVRHIVLTHLDFDHAGGLSDFPWARVHVLAAERRAAAARAGFVARQRYRPRQWDGAVDWRVYQPEGEAWFGFGAVRALDGLPPEILMVPLAGHTLGHAGVAIDAGAGWLLHAGDAYLHEAEMAAPPAMPPGLRLYQRIMDSDHAARLANLARLRALKQSHGDGVEIVCSHDGRDIPARAAAAEAAPPAP